MWTKVFIILMVSISVIVIYYLSNGLPSWSYTAKIVDLPKQIYITQISQAIPYDVDMYVATYPYPGLVQRINGNPHSSDYGQLEYTGIYTQFEPDIEFNPHNNYLYIGHKTENYISVFNRHLSFVTNIAIDDTDCEVEWPRPGLGQCDGPSGLFYDPKTEDIYVVTYLVEDTFEPTYVGGRIQVIDSDTNTLVNDASLTFPPDKFGQLILNPDDGNFYSLTKEGIYTIHMHGEQRGQITGPISVGDPTQSPREMAYNPTDSRLYVLKSGEYKIVPRPDLNHCYFDADWCNSLQAEQHCTPGSINVVDTVTNEEDTSIPNFDIDCPAGIAFTPRGEIFVTQDYREYGANNHCPPQDGTVFILDRNLDIIDFVRVGPCPSKISYDNLNGNMYVYNAKATLRDELNAISIISTIHPSIQSLATALVDNSNGQTFAHNALVPYGTKIQQGATISVAWDPYVQYYLPPTPTGTILYYRAAGNCEDAAFDISRGVPVPIDPKNAYYTLSPVSNLVNSKTVSFIAKYEGNYGSVFASCKSVNVVPPQINTVIRDKDGMDVTGRTLPVGTLIHDTAVISLPGGSPPDTLPSGTVTYRRYSTIDCDETGGFIDEPPVTIANGRVPDSQVITSTIPSEVSYKAFYDDWAESHCEKGTNFK